MYEYSGMASQYIQGYTGYDGTTIGEVTRTTYGNRICSGQMKLLGQCTQNQEAYVSDEPRTPEEVM
jgi:hypothetical protein